MNLELMEEHVSNVWLQQNSALEQIISNYSAETDALGKQLRELHKGRKSAQERLYPDLLKLLHRRDSAIVQKLQCQAAYQQIDAYLAQNGLSYDAHKQQQAELTRLQRLLDEKHHEARWGWAEPGLSHRLRTGLGFGLNRPANAEVRLMEFSR